MTARRQREFLKRELVQHRYFLDQSAGDPILEPQFASRLKEVAQQLASLPEVGREAKTTLYLSGGPTAGSQGLDAQFATELLRPFLEMVKTQYASVKNSTVGQRGVRRDESESRLLLTGTPRGSFGLELSAPETDDLFAEDRLADVLLDIGGLIEAAASSDEDYLSRLDVIHERAASRLPEFFGVLARNNAAIRIETGDHVLDLDPAAVRGGQARLEGSESRVDTIQIEGRFRGAVLEKWQYNFLTEGGDVLSGRIGDDVDEDQAVIWLGQVNQPAIGVFQRTRTTTALGASRSKHVLLELEIRGES